jgi:hypothetical protein
MQGKRMRYQMLWGALLTVRRMVMRPPASTPTGLTRAWPRKLVVCCSADAAIFAVSCVFGGARTMRMLVGLSGNSGTGAHLYTTSEWRSRRDWWTRAGAHWLPVISRAPASNGRAPSGDEDRVAQTQSCPDHTARSRVPVVLSRVSLDTSRCVSLLAFGETAANRKSRPLRRPRRYPELRNTLSIPVPCSCFW